MLDELVAPILFLFSQNRFDLKNNIAWNVGKCIMWMRSTKANLAVQEGRLGVAMKDLADAQAILDAKQAELDAVKVGMDKRVSE